MNNPWALRALGAIFFIGHWLLLPDLPLIRKVPVWMAAFSMSAMALSFVLAARWHWVETLTGGLDRSYRLHRWLGITALMGVLGHATLVPGGAGTPLFPALAGIGEDLGELSMWVLFALLLASMVQLLPYRIWRYSHYLMGPVFAIAVLHTFISDIPLALGSTAWTAMLAVSALGVYAWISKLWFDIKARPNYRVERITPVAGGNEIVLKPASRALHHRAGQFAFISFIAPGLREPHPFTIASADRGGELRFVVKALGDYTRELGDQLELNTLPRVEGPYGRFTYNPRQTRQLWVAGGIGVTPFLAFMESLPTDCQQKIDLLYCVRNAEDALYLDELQAGVEPHPSVHIHLVCSSEGQRLNSDWLVANLDSDWIGSQVYYCGPTGLREGLSAALHSHNVPASRLHYEHFDMRGAVELPRVIDSLIQLKAQLITGLKYLHKLWCQRRTAQ